MCCKCWIENGSPSIVNEKTIETAKLIESVYEFSCVGGNCHVFIDDWNVDDDQMEDCLDVITENYHKAGPEQLAAETACLDALKSLTWEERISALVIQDGCLEVPIKTE